MRIFIMFIILSTFQSCGQRPIDFVLPEEVVPTCPSNFIMVSKNTNFIGYDFCVAKYEMKNDGLGNAISQASSVPWATIDRDQAITACQNLGPTYNLISNAEWQTLARSIEVTASNWELGVVSVEDYDPDDTNRNSMNRGHSDNDPAFYLSLNSFDPYASTNNTDADAFGVGGEQKRVHYLKSGATIWDLAGNVSEWVRDNNITNYGADAFVSQISGSSHLNLGILDDGGERTARGQFGSLGMFTKLDATYFYGGLGHATLSVAGGAITRGGDKDDDLNAGIYNVDLSNAAAFTSPDIGFRCVYYP